MRIDLTAAAKKVRVDLGDVRRLEPKERRAQDLWWRARMLDEHVSAARYGELIGRAMRVGMPEQVISALAGFVIEELYHARLCAGVVRALGGEADGELGACEPLPIYEDVEPHESFVRNVIRVWCIEETIAVAQISAELEKRARTPFAPALARIRDDESGHAELGWKLLESLHLSAHPALARRLAGFVTHEFRTMVIADRLTYETITEIIEPSLARAGILTPRLASSYAATAARAARDEVRWSA